MRLSGQQRFKKRILRKAATRQATSLRMNTIKQFRRERPQRRYIHTKPRTSHRPTTFNGHSGAWVQCAM